MGPWDGPPIPSVTSKSTVDVEASPLALESDAGLFGVGAMNDDAWAAVAVSGPTLKTVRRVPGPVGGPTPWAS